MSDKYSFLVIKYPHPDTAMAALAALKELSRDKVVKLRDAVAVTKNEKGKIKVHQTKDDSIGKGFVKGGLIGVVFAALFGPVGWIAMGAAAGGLFASFDRGIKNRLLKELGENMTSAESGGGDPRGACRLADGGRAHEGARLRRSARRLRDRRRGPGRGREAARGPGDGRLGARGARDRGSGRRRGRRWRRRRGGRGTRRRRGCRASSGRTRIADVEGIGPAYAEKLAAAGIKTTDDLLAAGAKPYDREKLAESTGISPKLIREWVDKVDLMRVPGVGPQYSDLLEAAGVGSPAELAQRNPANLAVTVQEVAAARPGIVRRVPSEAEIAGWIEAAGSSTRSSSTDRRSLKTRHIRPPGRAVSTTPAPSAARP